MADGPEGGGPPGIDLSKPHSARMYDYFLGGKDNFASRPRDRGDSAAEHALGLASGRGKTACFLARAVCYLAGEAGIRQFLDIGTGLPTVSNVHEVAQKIAPESRVVYADNDPIVLAHAQALLTSSPAGRTAYIHADLREPEKILADPVVRDTLRLQPADRADTRLHPALHTRRRRPGPRSGRPCSRPSRRAATWWLAHHA